MSEADKEKQALTSPTLKKEKPADAKKPEKDSKKDGAIASPASGVKPEAKEHHAPGTPHQRAKMPDSELVRDLKAQLKYVLKS